jgi:hypothetical protein
VGRTLGIHWIATTHGTWLHGDVRGSWRQGRLIGPDPFLHDAIEKRMREDAVVLDDVEQMLVAAAVGEVIGEDRHRVYAATIQTTHVHLVFAPLASDVGEVIAKLKYRAARAVLKLRRNMCKPVPRSLWTTGQFPVFIFDTGHLGNAIQYVRRHNTRAGRAADPYEWIKGP